MKNLSKKIFITLASLSCVCSANRLAANALTKMANKAQNLEHTQNSNEIVVDDALIKKLQISPTVIKNAFFIATLCSLMGAGSGSLGTYLVMKDMYENKVQSVNKKLIHKYIDYAVIAGGFNNKLIITKEPSFFNEKDEKLFGTLYNYNNLGVEGRIGLDKLDEIAKEMGVSNTRFFAEVDANFYRLYFDILDNIRKIAKNCKLDTKIKKAIEEPLEWKFTITKENNKLSLEINGPNNFSFAKSDFVKKGWFVDAENKREYEKFFDEVENYLINNEYVKHIFLIR